MAGQGVKWLSSNILSQELMPVQSFEKNEQVENPSFNTVLKQTDFLFIEYYKQNVEMG